MPSTEQTCLRHRHIRWPGPLQRASAAQRRLCYAAVFRLSMLGASSHFPIPFPLSTWLLLRSSRTTAGTSTSLLAAGPRVQSTLATLLLASLLMVLSTLLTHSLEPWPFSSSTRLLRVTWTPARATPS